MNPAATCAMGVAMSKKTRVLRVPPMGLCVALVVSAPLFSASGVKSLTCDQGVWRGVSAPSTAAMMNRAGTSPSK